MHLYAYPTSTLNGFVTAPSSKSQSVRGMIFSLMAQGRSTLHNPLDSDDMQVAIQVCHALGAEVLCLRDKIEIQHTGLPLHSNISQLHTGNSGITTRFVLPLLGLRLPHASPIQVSCGSQMQARPIHSLVNALIKLGMSIHYLETEGRLPIEISGVLEGGQAEVDGITSQYLSALLISLPCAPKDSEIVVYDLHERPYVEMTLNWLKKLNIRFHHQHFKTHDVYQIPGRQIYHSFQHHIPGDFSSASYLLAAAVMTPGQVIIRGLDMSDAQGDKRLVSILKQMGAEIDCAPYELTIQGGKPLKGIEIDANDIPDLLPTLSVLGTYAQGQTQIRHVPQARLKETDRIHSMTEGLRRLGAHIEEHEDGMVVSSSSLRGAKVRGYDDHRTVMALALAGMRASQGPTIIDTGEAIQKTFPTFTEKMVSLGARLEMRSE